MKKFSKCEYGGGTQCRSHGGDGAIHHFKTYEHKFPSSREVGMFFGDLSYDIGKSQRVLKIPGLEDFFDEDLSKSVLDISIEDGKSVGSIAKSLYTFDLDDAEGVKKLLELLPVLATDILVDIMAEIWPGYVADDADPDLMKAEIKGYLMDFVRDFS